MLNVSLPLTLAPAVPKGLLWKTFERSGLTWTDFWTVGCLNKKPDEVVIAVVVVYMFVKGIMTWKVLSMVAVAGIASLLHYETENDVLYVEKEVVVSVSRAKAFMFIADTTNYRRVRCLLFNVLLAFPYCMIPCET